MRRAPLLVLLLVALLGGCSRDTDTDESAAAPVVYVAVGDSITFGIGLSDPATEAWPRLFRDRSLPDDATFANLGISGATVATATQQQLPKALAAEPTLVTVWLGVNDLIGLVPAATYEQQLRDLVRRLRREGRATVLMANIPALDQLPTAMRFAPVAVIKGAVAAYNAVVARIASEEGAVLVDVHAEGVDTGFLGPDNFHPSAVGHKAIAEAFARAYERSEAVALSR